jgi:hypothetical protein
VHDCCLVSWVTCLAIEQQSQQESPGPSEREKEATAIKGQKCWRIEAGSQRRGGAKMVFERVERKKKKREDAAMQASEGKQGRWQRLLERTI